MFAFGVWDGRRQELLLARDRLGVKPLYYAARQDGVLFGSEPKAILAHPDFRAEIDAEGLAELFGQVGTGTPGHGVYRGLSQVRPGTLGTVGRDGIRESAYWRLEAREHADDLASTAGTVRELLADIVHRQTVADVPLCSLLSGGLDSSVVSALAADSLAGGTAPSWPPSRSTSPAARMPSRPTSCGPATTSRSPAPPPSTSARRHSTIILAADDLVTAQWAPLAAHDLPTFGDM